MPRRLLSQLAHVELETPKLEESVAFAVDVLGLDVVKEVGDSVYLRCWGDYYSHSLVLTRAEQPGIGHAAWRAEGPEELEIAVSRIDAGEYAGEWIDGSFGQGRTYRFAGPGGHSTEIFWEVERALAPPGEESPYPERPQRSGTRGLRVRLLDHLTVTAPDVEKFAAWHSPTLGFRKMAYIDPGQGMPTLFAILTTNEKSHDLGCIRDHEGVPGRLHHVAFWVETNHDLTSGAKFLVEHGCEVDYGPGQHGIGEQDCLYFRDPAGLRYELNAGGYRNYVPDWQPVRWTPEDGPQNAYRTEVAFPPVLQVSIPPGTLASAREKRQLDDGANPLTLT